ncbi:hypothetical protein Misp01_79010 [Microtetraspora sp. NBRC 13810]|nr:hypothetical protein Misp01_79010 [Microtetraspora sp. NBRC 13810]
MTYADSPPERKFQAGVHFLDGGMPGRAWQLIQDAVAGGYRTNKVCFHWLLALVSGRTRYGLSKEEAAMLRNERNLFRLTGDDEWAEGVRTIRRLLDSAGRKEADTRVLLKELDELGEPQRAMILRHLEQFLDGPIAEQMWHRALSQAKREQMAGDRANRLWKFFEPAPLGLREQVVQQPNTPLGVYVRIVMATAVFLAATVHLGYMLVQGGRVIALLAYLSSIVGGYYGVRKGVEWRFRVLRRRAKDMEYGPPSASRSDGQPEGFAKRVDHRVDHYFAVYVPSGVDRELWLASTAGIRRSLRDELVEIYREKRVGVEKIDWLIRHRVGVVRRRWQAGTLWSYRGELATPLSTKAGTVLGLAASVAGGTWAVSEALLVAPLGAFFSTVLGLASGWLGVRAVLGVLLERRRFAADKRESMQTLDGDREALGQWRAKLADKPKDREMAVWLDCERKLVLDEVLKHYRLTMSNVIAHAFIEAPAPSTRRARVTGGPWRYRKYRLLAFLLTADGVRQLTVDLNFDEGAFRVRERSNYRFDMIAAVRVRQGDDGESIFELAIVDGQKISVQVMDPGTEVLQEGETPGAVSEVTLDASGLHYTLHVLEGIAAEGKEWLEHENRRGGERA